MSRQFTNDSFLALSLDAWNSALSRLFDFMAHRFQPDPESRFAAKAEVSILYGRAGSSITLLVLTVGWTRKLPSNAPSINQ
jgi:hypothetical protein